MEQKILILAYPGIGKTYTADNYENAIDFEHQFYKFIYDDDIKHLPLDQIKGATSKRRSNPDYPSNYIKAVEEALEEDRIVIVPFTPDVFEALCVRAQYRNVRKILAVFDKNNFEELAERYRERNNSEEFIERRRSDFPSVIKLFETAKNVEKIVIESRKYLSDALVLHGIELKPGKGLRNYN